MVSPSDNNKPVNHLSNANSGDKAKRPAPQSMRPDFLFSLAKMLDGFSGYFPQGMAEWYQETKIQWIQEELQKQKYDLRDIETATANYLSHPSGEMAATISTEVQKRHADRQAAAKKRFGAEGQAVIPDQNVKDAQQIIQALKSEFGAHLDEEAKAALAHHQTYLSICGQLDPEAQSAYRHIREVFEELRKGKYPDPIIKVTLTLLLKMTAPGIREETLRNYTRLKSLQNEGIEPTSEGKIGVLKKEGETVAKVRTVFSNSVYGGNSRYERLAYEVDHALGGDNVPPAVPAYEGKPLLQQFVTDAKQLETIQNQENGAEILQKLDLAQTQAYLTFGLIRGRHDGNFENTIVQQQSDGTYRLFDIDEEEDFHPELRTISSMDANDASPLLSCTLGLPQAGQIYPRVLLKLFSWEGMRERALRQAEARHLPRNRLNALDTRLQMITEICRCEYSKEHPQLTPRDLYFALHGQDYIYYQLKKWGVSDLEIFNERFDSVDQWVDFLRARESHPEKQTSFLIQNGKALDSRVDATYPSVKLIDRGGEQVRDHEVGGAILRSVFRGFQNKNEVELFEVDPSLMDFKGWQAYQARCEEEKREYPPFALGQFIKPGQIRRMVRQLAYLYPLCRFEFVENSEKKLMLKIVKPDFLIQLDEKLKNPLNGSLTVCSIPKKEFDRSVLKLENFDKYPSENLIKHGLSGHSRDVARWIWDMHMSSYGDHNLYFTVQDMPAGAQLVCLPKS